MVTTPVPTTLATAEPEIDPKRPEANTEIFIDPPRNRPMPIIAASVKNCDPPVMPNSTPNRMKAITTVAATDMGRPRTPFESTAR